MPGARCTRSLVCAIGSKYAHEYSQRAIGNHPTFPHAMVYGLYRALPGDRLSCHRRYADRSANLTPASRRQDHTSSPSASNIVRQHAGRRSRETRPAIPCTPDAAASTATRPNVHDDGQRPSDRRAVPGMIHYDAAHARQIQREPDTFRLSRLRKGRACST
jgi:hypothetical protein